MEGRIPYVRFRVLGVSPDDEIALDEKPFPQAGLNESLPLNPGAHTIKVSRDGRVLATRKFTLSEADSKTVDIKVEPKAPEPEPGPAVSGANLVQTDKRGPVDNGSKDDGGSIFGSPWFWGAVVVVVAGGATGGYFLTRDNVGDPTEDTLGRGVIEF